MAVFALNPIAGFAGQDHMNAPRATEESHRRARETWLQRKQPAQVAEEIGHSVYIRRLEAGTAPTSRNALDVTDYHPIAAA